MGKFEGLTDNEWAAIEPIMPPYPWSATKHGKRPMHPGKILNTLIWILTTGARWCDVPVGEQWASRLTVTHKFLYTRQVTRYRRGGLSKRPRRLTI
jgi:transposase